MERMFFLLPDPDGETEIVETGGISVFIGITGEIRFLVTLAFDDELASRMTAGLLGPRAELDEGMKRACLLEAANIIAGIFLRCQAGGTDRNATLPSFQRDEIFSPAIPLKTGRFSLQFEKRCVSAILETIAGQT